MDQFQATINKGKVGRISSPGCLHRIQETTILHSLSSHGLILMLPSIQAQTSKDRQARISNLRRLYRHSRIHQTPRLNQEIISLSSPLPTTRQVELGDQISSHSKTICKQVDGPDSRREDGDQIRVRFLKLALQVVVGVQLSSHNHSQFQMLR